MDNFWQIFKEICTVPRCSGNAKAMETYIGVWAKKYGYKVQTDKSGNVFCTHAQAKLTLQAHYDMVCLGNAPDIKLHVQSGKMSAVNSTLGADNGIGVALMLEAMQMGLPVDMLFTADEEIGLKGAMQLEHRIKTPYVLNLDSEESEAVFIGCAGGVTIKAMLPLVPRYVDNISLYEVSVDHLPGGHSGLDIDKNIPNALLELAKRVQRMDAKLSTFEGGERRNTIAVACKARVAWPSGDAPQSLVPVEIQSKGFYYENSDKLLSALVGMPHGVKKHNKEYNIPNSSVNFAKAAIIDHVLHMELSLRSFDPYGMNVLVDKTQNYLTSIGCSVKLEGEYAPWMPQKSNFSQMVFDSVEKIEGFCAFKAIHAGLECGVLQHKAPKLEFASIGPDITGAHTTKESVDIGSCERFRAIVHDLVSVL